MEIAVITIIVAVLIVGMILILGRSGDHAALDEENTRPVRDRPAGPGAEGMNAEVAGEPTAGPAPRGRT